MVAIIIVNALIPQMVVGIMIKYTQAGNRFFCTILFMLILLSCSLFVYPKGAFRNIEVGQTGPNFVLEGGKGETYNLISEGAAANLFIFWRPGQSRSERAMADLQKVWMEMAGKEINIIGITGAEDKEEMIKAGEELGLTFPIVMDPNREVYGAYGALTVPSLGILDKDGILVYYHANYDQKFSKRIKGELEILLGTLSREDLEAQLTDVEPKLSDEQKTAIRYSNLAGKLLTQGKLDRALSYFQKAYEADKNNKELLVVISTLLIKMERWAEAGEIMGEIEAEFPKNTRVFLNKAIIALHNNDLEASRSALEYALVRNPRLADGYFYLGQIEEISGNTEAALGAYKKAVHLLLPDVKAIKK